MKFKDYLLEYDMKKLKDNKIPMEPEERKEAMKRGAVWHHGPNGEATCAIWKAKTSSGEIKYVCNTHRAIQMATTLAGAIKAFEFIKTTA